MVRVGDLGSSTAQRWPHVLTRSGHSGEKLATAALPALDPGTELAAEVSAMTQTSYDALLDEKSPRGVDEEIAMVKSAREAAWSLRTKMRRSCGTRC